MKRSNPVAWRKCWLVTMVGVAIFSSSVRADPVSQKQAPAPAITIVDQNGHLVPNNPPSATSQIFDVTVGPNGMFVFSPDVVNISVGTQCVGLGPETTTVLPAATLALSTPNSVHRTILTVV